MAIKMLVLALALLLAPAAATVLDRESSQKERPVTKVIRLLSDMRVELDKELEDDRQVHETLGCWCKANEQDKTTAIELGQAESEQLKSTMDESAAKVVELRSRRKTAMEDISNNQKSLGEATALRMSDNRKFHGEETDLMEAVAAAKQAVVVLSKHHPELAQVRQAALRLHGSQVARLLARAPHLRGEQLELLKGFLQQAAQASSFLSIPGFQSFAPQSGQIFGILRQLQSDFEGSLTDAQKAEIKAQEEYLSLKAAKEAEVAAGQKEVLELDSALAEFGERAVRAARELEDVEAQLGLDRTFLVSLQKRCAESETEFDARVKSRQEEISAVQDAVKILSEDKAFDSFGKTVGASLLQTSSGGGAASLSRRRAVAVLQAAAAKSGEPKLALLAAAAQLDAFEKVQAAIDKLVEELLAQQKDEVAHRDWCTDEVAANGRAAAAADDRKVGLLTKISDLENAIATTSASVDGAKAAVVELNLQMKRASETREAQNADYQQTMVDQHLTQQILVQATNRLRQVYAMVQERAAEHEDSLFEDPEQPGAPHIQTSGNHTDAGNGPARYTKYEQHAGGSRAVTLLDDIVADSKRTEDEAVAGEQDAQAAYEGFMKDSNQSLEAHARSIADLSASKAQAEESLSLAKEDLRQTLGELEGLSLTSADVHRGCDFVLKNFDERQGARSAEVESLRQAKAILSGMQ